MAVNNSAGARRDRRPRLRHRRLRRQRLLRRHRLPPTLLITGTRAFDMSPAIATHRALVQAGVEAQLHVFDGQGHCFYYDAASPEGADANQTIIRFFRRHLAG